MRYPNASPRGLVLAGLLAFTTALLSTWGRAEDLRTKDGHIFKNVVVVGDETERIKVRHDDGSGWINKKELPEAFATAHGIQSSSNTARELADEKRSKNLLIGFRYRFKEIRTTDARVYPSSEIVALESSFLKLQRASGIERIKLADLVAEQREALGFDADKVRESEADLKLKQSMAKSAEESKLFAQTSARASAMYAHARVVQKVPDGYICSVWQITPSQPNASLSELIDLAGAVPDREPSSQEIIRESTFALVYSAPLRDFILVSYSMFPVRGAGRGGCLLRSWKLTPTVALCFWSENIGMMEPMAWKG